MSQTVTRRWNLDLGPGFTAGPPAPDRAGLASDLKRHLHTHNQLGEYSFFLPPRSTQVATLSQGTNDGVAFRQLLEEWNRLEAQNATSSVMTDLYMSRPYQNIIGMGRAALPFIFEDLRREPRYWFWALKAITRTDPVAAQHRGNLDKMTADWLGWAETQGL